MKVPLGMLITSATFINESQSEIFGFWYYAEMYVPSSIDEKKRLFHDLMTGRSVQLMVRGSFQQVSELLLQTDTFDGTNDKQIKHYTSLLKALRENPGRSVSFDDIMSPRGSGLSLDTVCEFDETIESIKSKIAAKKDEIILAISPGWSFNETIL